MMQLFMPVSQHILLVRKSLVLCNMVASMMNLINNQYFAIADLLVTTCKYHSLMLLEFRTRYFSHDDFSLSLLTSTLIVCL
jgi:hypothetical protein